MTSLSPARELGDVVEALERGAPERDRTGSGLEAALTRLEAVGALAVGARPGPDRPPAAGELALVRRVAAADSSVARVLDGHLNGVERLAVQTDREHAEAALALVRDGLLRLGVWGGEPRGEEGPGAEVVVLPGGREVLRGVKTFCSGAGAIDRALVLARQAGAPAPVLVWIDVRDAERVRIDPTWYRSSGLRASASHRVVFEDAPVLARCGPPGAITAQPWFGRDALRTAATWAGMADAAVTAALGELASRPHRGDLEALAAGRLIGARRTLDVWLAAGARAMDEGGEDLAEVALHGRVAIAEAARRILETAATACGSHPYATGGTLDRVRRDLDLFLLQHRLDPGVARSGAAALAAALDRRPDVAADPR